MQIRIEADGNVRCVYAEAIELKELGKLSIRRGSHVEPNELGQWLVNLSPVSGPSLGPFQIRSEAIKAELHWLEEHWLERDRSRR